jgi:hypothetical protein
MLAQRRAALLAALRTGVSRSEATRLAHVSRQEFYAELQRMPSFRREVAEAMESGDSRIRRAAWPLPRMTLRSVLMVAGPALLAATLILLGVDLGNARLAW